MGQPSDKSPSGDLFERDSKVVLRPWSGSGEPMPIVKASGCEVTDESGNTFLDFTSGYFVNQAGHCHPNVVAAAKAQLDEVTQVSGRHTTRPVVELAERLTGAAPTPLDRIFFTTGGTESNEFAVRMARQHTGKTDLACLENAYHGLSLGVLGACGSEKYRATGGVPDIQRHWTQIPNAYCYRCKFKDNCEVQCLDGVEERLAERPEICAVLAEPMQSVGGLRPPQKWWDRLDGIRKKRGLLLILDEIQTGLGRTGKMFAAEHYGLEPEIMSIGKGMSGGVGSLGGVLCNHEVVGKFYGGTTPTSAGNAVSAAAGVALFDTLLGEKLIENAAKMGEYFSGAVADLNDPWVGDIRFTGLLGGVELVADRDSQEVLPSNLIQQVKDTLHNDGMLLTVSGPLKNTLRLQPSLVITAAELDRFVSSLSAALTAVRKAAG